LVQMNGPPVHQGSDSLLDRGRAVFEGTASQSHVRWMAEVGNHQIAPAAEAYEQADADGEITPDEVADLAELVDGLPDKAMERAGRTGEALDTLLAIGSTQERTTDFVEAVLGDNPELAETICGKPCDTADAKQALLDQQDVSEALSAALNEFQPREDDLDEWIAAYNEEVRAYNFGFGGDKEALDAELAEIEAAIAELEHQQQPIVDALANSQSVLRGFDMAAAGLAYDPDDPDAPDFLADMEVALANLEAVQGVADALPDPGTDEAAAEATQKVVAFAEAATLGYEAAIEAPRLPDNKLGDMRLPSTGAPDLALAMRAADGIRYFSQLAWAPNSPFINEDGSDLSLDQITNMAATWVHGDPADLSEVARLGSTPQTADEAIQLMAGLTGLGYDEARDAYFRRSNVAFIEALGSSLSDPGRDNLADVIKEEDPWSVSGYFHLAHETSQIVLGETVRRYNRKHGHDTDNFGVNVGRGALTAAMGTLFIAPTVIGGVGVEFENRLEHGGLAQDPASIVNFTISMLADDPIRPGESNVEYYTRKNPLTGSMLVTPASNIWNRWTKGRVAEDYHDRPVESMLEDTSLILLVLAPATAALRAGAVGAAVRGATARATATRITSTAPDVAQRLLRDSARFEKRAARFDTASKLLDVPVRLASAPYELAGRVAALGARAVAAPAARLALDGSKAAARRAVGARVADVSGDPSTMDFWNGVSIGLEHVAGGLARGAEYARMVARYGTIGARQASYKNLRVSHGATDEAIWNAWKPASMPSTARSGWFSNIAQRSHGGTAQHWAPLKSATAC
jgi:hypothetical protein